jgi:hypothetical protein
MYSERYFQDQVRGLKVVMAAFEAADNQVCHGGITLPSYVRKAAKRMKKLNYDMMKTDLADSFKQEIKSELGAMAARVKALPTETADKPCNVEAGNCFIGPDACVVMGSMALMDAIDAKYQPAEASSAKVEQQELAPCGSAEAETEAAEGHVATVSSNGAKKVLLVLPDGAEDVEVAAFAELPNWTNVVKTTPIQVTTAGWNDVVSCFHTLKLVPDIHISEANIDDYDALAIPGGWPGTPFDEQTNGEVFRQLLLDACSKDKIVATMCFGIFPLGEAGLLEGVKATSFTSEDETCPT